MVSNAMRRRALNAFAAHLLLWLLIASIFASQALLTAHRVMHAEPQANAALAAHNDLSDAADAIFGHQRDDVRCAAFDGAASSGEAVDDQAPCLADLLLYAKPLFIFAAVPAQAQLLRNLLARAPPRDALTA